MATAALLACGLPQALITYGILSFLPQPYPPKPKRERCMCGKPLNNNQELHGEHICLAKDQSVVRCCTRCERPLAFCATPLCPTCVEIDVALVDIGSDTTSSDRPDWSAIHYLADVFRFNKYDGSCQYIARRLKPYPKVHAYIREFIARVAYDSDSD